MHAISKRWRKPKGRMSKKTQKLAEMRKKRWNKLTNGESTENTNEILCDKDNCTVNNNPVMQSKSVSANKLEILPSTSAAQEKMSDEASYVMMNTDMWTSLLGNIKCDECDAYTLDVKVKKALGFSSAVEMYCKSCDKVYSSIFSSPCDNDNKGFEANKKFVDAFLKIGKGHAALEIFSMAIGIYAMDKKTFSKCLHSLYEEKQNLKKKILEISRTIIRTRHGDLDGPENDNGIIDVTVSYDGTWQKRGHTSINGIGIVVDVLTGLVIDYEILSKYCPECTAARRDLGDDSAEFYIWQRGHQAECSENYSGSSNAMEMIAGEILWKRSVSNCGMRYHNMLSDGDAKTFQHLSSLNVYGDDLQITKEDCINHVAKRIGTGLRNKISEWRAKGVCLGGRKVGSLKEETINKLTNFYRKAIKDNAPDLEKMKTAIYASLFHCSSTDEKPKHNKCPPGSSSWCFYQRAIANGEKPKSHMLMKTKLSEDVLSKILPVYQRLASNTLLARCTSGKTQNANESLHSLIWKNCPKETFVSKKRLEIGVISAISDFNFGCLNSLAAESEDFNALSASIAKRRDKRRLDQEEKRNSCDWKKKRISKKLSKCAKNKKMLHKEGETYSAGQF